MFFSTGGMLEGEEHFMEAGEGFFNVFVLRGEVAAEGEFEGGNVGIIVLEELYEIQKVYPVKGPVTEGHQLHPVARVMVTDVVIGRVVHMPHQFRAFVDDAGAVAPGEDGSKEAGNFYVLQFAEAVRDANGVICNEIRMIIGSRFRIQEVLQLLDLHSVSHVASAAWLYASTTCPVAERQQRRWFDSSALIKQAVDMVQEKNIYFVKIIFNR